MVGMTIRSIVAVSLCAILLMFSGPQAQASTLCDFEDHVADPKCETLLGATWSSNASPTNSSPRFGDWALYNNFNADITLTFNALYDFDGAWFARWARFQAKTVTVQGKINGLTVASQVLNLTTSMLFYSFGNDFDAVDELVFSPFCDATSGCSFGLNGFGTFAIENAVFTSAESVPEPLALGLFGIGLASLGAAARRR